MDEKGELSQEEIYKDISATIAVLTKLASEGLLSTGHGEIPRLVFDESDLAKLNHGADKSNLHFLQ